MVQYTPQNEARWFGSYDSFAGQESVLGFVINPAGGTVIGDSLQLARGFYDFIVYMAANAAFNYGLVEHRNATNNATLTQVAGPFTIYDSAHIYWRNLKIESNERVRVIQPSAVPGSYYVSITWVIRAL